MTLRELTALVHLYRACTDPVIRERAVALVPDLDEWSGEPPVSVSVSRWKLTVFDRNGAVDTTTVVARESEVKVHATEFQARYPLLIDPRVKVEPLP